MKNIDTEWLRKVGVPGTEKELKQLADHVYNVLELRIGDKISRGLNEAQLAEAEHLADKGAVSVEWLENAYPGYQKVVAAEYAKFRRGIVRSTDKTQYILNQKG